VRHAGRAAVDTIGHARPLHAATQLGKIEMAVTKTPALDNRARLSEIRRIADTLLRGGALRQAKDAACGATPEHLVRKYQHCTDITQTEPPGVA
jgi:hypothetical protein